MRKAVHDQAHLALCSFLRAARLEQGLRQVGLADRLEMPQSYVSTMENGQRRLDLVEVDQVCEALGVPLAEAIAAYTRARPGPKGSSGE